MKKFVSLLTSMIVTLFVIGCSNPSSSSGGSLGMGGQRIMEQKFIIIP